MASKRHIVGELMSPDVVCVRPSATVREAEELLVQRRISGAAVVDDAGHPVGVISQSDLVRHQTARVTAGDAGRFFTDVEDYREIAQVPMDRSHTPVEQVMNRKVFSVSRDTGVSAAASIMRERRIHRLLVTDRGILVGVVTSMDMLRLIEELC